MRTRQEIMESLDKQLKSPDGLVPEQRIIFRATMTQLELLMDIRELLSDILLEEKVRP
jgi:hypothetical protein